MTAPAEAAPGSTGVAPVVLVIDDSATDRGVLDVHLQHLGCRVVMADGGIAGVQAALRIRPDLVLLDVMLPDIDGFAVCSRLKNEGSLAGVPLILVTALDDVDDRVRGLDAGADDFLSKPFAHAELKARVRSLLRLKAARDRVDEQRRTLSEWAERLEERVADKLREVERLSRLKRFFSPSLAAKLLAEGRDVALGTHRREITVLFADLRGFTAFAERADADDLMRVVDEFHVAMGELIHRHDGTLERFTGDGMMVFFNDPDECADHGMRAVRLACDMLERSRGLVSGWRSGDGPEGLGIGLSQGMATIGPIGFEGRVDYAAIGPVTNRAARLCAQAPSGAIFACEKVWGEVASRVVGHEEDRQPLKGLASPAITWRITGLRDRPVTPHLP